MSDSAPQTPLVIDPTENLTEQLATAAAVLADDNAGEPAKRLAVLVLALHDWLEHGGSVPDQWQGSQGDALDDDADPTIADMDGTFGFGSASDDDA